MSFVQTLSESTSRKSVASAVVRVQEYLGLRVNTVGTLVKKPVEELHEMVGSLLGDDLTFDDDGQVVPVVVEAEEVEADDYDGPTVSEERAADRGQGRALFSLDAVITVVVASNPKREGSASAARFGAARSGQTVREFIAAVAAATGSPKHARRTLRKAVAAGQLVVTEPGA